MSLLLTIIYSAFFAYIISKKKIFQLEGINKCWLIGAFVIKILAAYIMVKIYTYHYPNRNEADIFKFFDDGETLYSSIFIHPFHYFQMLSGIYFQPDELAIYFEKMHWWYKPIYPNAYNEARIMIRLNSFLMIFSFGNYMVHAVFMSFLAFIGSVNIYKLGIKLINQPKNLFLFGGILLLPSVVFWCSGVLKEGLVLFCLGGLFYNGYLLLTAKAKRREVINNLGFVFLYFLLLVLVKPYLVGCFLPGLLALFFARKQNNKYNQLLIFSAINILFTLVLFNLYLLGQKFDVVYQLCYKRGEYIYLAEQLKAGSLLFNNYLDFHWWAIIKEAPVAFYHTLLSPLPWQASNTFILMSSLENIVVIVFFIFIMYKSKQTPNKYSVLSTQYSICLFLLNFLVYAFVLIGLTTPVAGSIMRYKAPLLPILIVFVFIISSQIKRQEANKIGTLKI